MIKQILALGTFAAAGVAVAALADDDFRDKLVNTGRGVKDAFCKKVDAEEDETCESPANNEETDPEPFNNRFEDYMNSAKPSEEGPIVAPPENKYPGNDNPSESIDEGKVPENEDPEADTSFKLN